MVNEPTCAQCHKTVTKSLTIIRGVALCDECLPMPPVTVTAQHPDFREPPQEMVPFCAGCEQEIERDSEWQILDEYECKCGAVGRIVWRLRYPATDRAQ